MKLLPLLLFVSAIALPAPSAGAQAPWWWYIQVATQNTTYTTATYMWPLWSPPAPVITDIPDDDGEPGTWIDLVGQNFDNLSFSPYIAATATPKIHMISRGDQPGHFNLPVTVVSPTLIRVRIPTNAQWGGYDIELVKKFQSSVSSVAPWTEVVSVAPNDFVVNGDAVLHQILNLENRRLEQVYINGLPVLPPGTTISYGQLYYPGLFTLDAGRWGRDYMIEVKYEGVPRVTYDFNYTVYPLTHFQLQVSLP